MWLVKYRDLIRILTISDLKVKYQSSVLGFAWSLLNPLLMMLILYFVFSSIFKIAEEHFAIYLLIGIVCWRFFSNGTSSALGVIVNKPSLVTKIYLPRQILVFSNVLSSFISSILEFGILFLFLVFFQIPLSYPIVLFPFLHVLYFFMVLGVSLALASIYVYYRDLNQIWEVILQIGFFLAPIAYPVSIIPKGYLDAYLLNPITAFIRAYRDVFMYSVFPGTWNVLFLVLVTAGILCSGWLVFKRLEPRFAEEL